MSQRPFGKKSRWSISSLARELVGTFTVIEADTEIPVSTKCTHRYKCIWCIRILSRRMYERYELFRILQHYYWIPCIYFNPSQHDACEKMYNLGAIGLRRTVGYHGCANFDSRLNGPYNPRAIKNIDSYLNIWTKTKSKTGVVVSNYDFLHSYNKCAFNIRAAASLHFMCDRYITSCVTRFYSFLVDLLFTSPLCFYVVTCAYCAVIIPCAGTLLFRQ